MNQHKSFVNDNMEQTLNHQGIPIPTGQSIRGKMKEETMRQQIEMQMEREKKMARQSNELYNRLDEMTCAIKSLKKAVKKLSKRSLRRRHKRS